MTDWFEKAKAKRKKPCPFCAAPNKELELTKMDGAPATYVVSCFGCGAEGPVVKFDPLKAVEAWNNRLTKQVPLR